MTAPLAPVCTGREGWRSEAFAEDFFLGSHGDGGVAFSAGVAAPKPAGRQRPWPALLPCALPLTVALTVALVAGLAACLQTLA